VPNKALLTDDPCGVAAERQGVRPIQPLMTWKPITLSQLLQLVDADLAEADDEIISQWEAIRIPPTKWSCSPMGDLGGGFWVVAVHESTVLWFNDIEDGFNQSPFVQEGVISQYKCNQTDLHQCLLHVVSAQQSGATPSQLGSVEIPDCLRGPGNIVRRQTTYWTLQPEGGPMWRVHFTDKVEFEFAHLAFPSLKVLSEHPLLADHCEPWQTLYFRGTPLDPNVLLAKARDTVDAITKGWRRFDQYVNRSSPLTGGYGALLSAPLSLASPIACLLNEYGCQTSVLPYRSASEPGTFKVCLLGRSYVIARDFRFAPLIQTSPA
jgi:hypothetical protein